MIIHICGSGCRYRLLGKTLEIIDAGSTSIGTYHCIVTHSATGQVKSGDVSLSKFDLLNHQAYALSLIASLQRGVIASVMNMFSR